MLLAQDERLVEFRFASRFDADVPPESILRVARQSWSDNQRAGVTGYLRLDGARIEQAVEGASSVILGLASRILTDRRHCEIVIRRFGLIGARRFADWSVAGLESFAPVPEHPHAPSAALRLLSGAAAPRTLDDAPALAVARAT